MVNDEWLKAVAPPVFGSSACALNAGNSNRVFGLLRVPLKGAM